MKKRLLTLFMAAIIYNGYGQGSLPKDRQITSPQIDSGHIETPPPPQNEPFTWVQEMPKFPGGDAALLKYIQDHINSKACTTHGRITVRFEVDEKGDVKMASVPKGMGMGGGCDEEAVRVVSSLPKWQPGKQNGHAVAVWYTAPVRFE